MRKQTYTKIRLYLNKPQSSRDLLYKELSAEDIAFQNFKSRSRVFVRKSKEMFLDLAKNQFVVSCKEYIENIDKYKDADFVCITVGVTRTNLVPLEIETNLKDKKGFVQVSLVEYSNFSNKDEEIELILGIPNIINPS